MLQCSLAMPWLQNEKVKVCQTWSRKLIVIHLHEIQHQVVRGKDDIDLEKRFKPKNNDDIHTKPQDEHRKEKERGIFSEDKIIHFPKASENPADIDKQQTEGKSTRRNQWHI